MGKKKTDSEIGLCSDCKIETGKNTYNYRMNPNLKYIELKDTYWSKPIDRKYQHTKNSKSENKELIKEFPFLMPCKKTIDNQLGLNKKYDYSFTILDFIKPVYLDKFYYSLFMTIWTKYRQLFLAVFFIYKKFIFTIV